MTELESLELTSHIGRDILQAASSFKTEAAAIWEYVVNSLQYVDEGVLPKVQVIIKQRAKTIEIRDNGRGMTAEDLTHFFKMHGENIDRLRGRPGRGKFGTGKSAALGIGEVLRIDTRRNNVRNEVVLDRQSIVSSDGSAIPLDWVVRNDSTDFPNGTTVSIERIFLSKLSTAPIIEYIERHLQTFRALMPEVAVNEHVCQYREPQIAEEHNFRPTNLQSEIIGDAVLTIKVATSPLPKTEQGIAITSGLGNLLAIETGGIETKEFGNYLFGEIDVPELEKSDSPIAPFDPTRSLQLNLQHPVARVLLPFIGSKLEEVRKEQVKKLRAAQKTEEARRLNAEAQRIAEILNQDFKAVIGRLNDIRSASARPGDVNSHFGESHEAGSQEGVWVEGTEMPGDYNSATGKDEKSSKQPKGSPDPNVTRKGSPDQAGPAAVDPAGGEGRKKHRPRGGFNVDFRHLGGEADRSKYDRTSLTILINLEHPVVKNALRQGGIEDINFRRLAYEIAFTEYSIALGYEMAEQDPDIPADDLLFEVRSTLNRVSASAAQLYA